MMARQIRTICFTGHRPDKLGGYDPKNPTAQLVIEKLDWAIRSAVQHNGTRVFVTGMALGVDQWAALLVLQYRAELELDHSPLAKEIKLVAAVPMASQALIWPRQSRSQWSDILDLCDEIYVRGKLVTRKTLDDAVQMLASSGHRMDRNEAARLMDERNRFMVDMVDGVIAVWDGSKGGTGNCVAYARQIGRPICIIDPRDGSVRKEG